jgi:hypothetical protein
MAGQSECQKDKAIHGLAFCSKIGGFTPELISEENLVLLTLVAVFWQKKDILEMPLEGFLGIGFRTRI